MAKTEGATFAIWQDPSTYDPMLHGPPFLRSMGMAKEAAVVATGEIGRLLSEAGAVKGWRSVTLAFLRSCAVVHQTHHWQTHGQPAYGDHLLFERLYNDSLDAIDTFAEKSIAFCGHDVVDARQQVGLIGKIVGIIHDTQLSTVGAESYPMVSLRAEVLLLLLLKMVYSLMEEAGSLSMGMDNLLQDIADQHEQFVYLLQQRIAPSSKQASVDRWKSWAK